MLLCFFAFINIVPQLASAAETITVTVLDTGFCPKRINNKNIKILPIQDLTNSVKLNCSKYNLREKRFHGQWVLEEFIDKLDKNIKSLNIIIRPVIIFDSKRRQRLSYWQKAFSKGLQERTDIYLSAIGLPLDERVELAKINTITFVSAGRISPGIKKNTILWPQLLAPQPQLFIIGSYHPALYGDDILFDHKLINREKIDYYFSEGPSNEKFKGSSRAVATALSLAINHCSKNIKSNSTTLRKCLIKKRKRVEGKMLPKMWTY